MGDRTKFRGTYMRIKTEGSATLVLRGTLNEKYTLTYPSLDVTGIITGKTKASPSGSCTIDCAETKVSARIKFGDKGSVKIVIGSAIEVREEGTSDKSTITGVWNKALYIKKTKEFWIPTPLGTESRKYMKPVNMLGPMESWKVWEMVTLHLAMGMFDQAGQFKHELEEKERAKSKARAAAGRKWEPVFFTSDKFTLRDQGNMLAWCTEDIWPNATVEISLPVITRKPLIFDDM